MDGNNGAQIFGHLVKDISYFSIIVSYKTEKGIKTSNFVLNTCNMRKGLKTNVRERPAKKGWTVASYMVIFIMWGGAYTFCSLKKGGISFLSSKEGLGHGKIEAGKTFPGQGFEHFNCSVPRVSPVCFVS